MRIDEVIMPGLKRGTRFNDWKKSDQIDLRAYVDRPGLLTVKAYLKDGTQIGRVEFSIEGKNLQADQVVVNPEFRRQGIATMMYDYAESLGNTIVPSMLLSPDSEAFWNARNKS